MPHSWAKKETPTFAPNDCSGSVHTWPDSFATHMNHSYVWRDLFIHATWLIHMRDMTHSHFMRSNQVINTFTLIPHYCRGSIHICDMTHSYVWHDPFASHMKHSCTRWHAPLHPTIAEGAFIRDMTHSYVTQLIHMLSNFHLCTWWLLREHSYVTWPILTWRASFVGDAPHLYVAGFLSLL